MDPLAQTILSVAAVAGGLTVIVATAVKIYRLVDRVEDAWVVLEEIAIQFRPNGGNSLHDQMTGIRRDVSQVQRDLESVLIERHRAPNVVRAEVDIEGSAHRGQLDRRAPPGRARPEGTHS